MKKAVLFLLASLSAVIMAACNNSGGDYPYYRPIWTTVHTLDNNDYYFRRNNGQTLYPGDKTRVAGYRAVDGQRAIIAFNLLDTPLEGYDYNIVLYDVRNILTKDPVVVTSSEQMREIGDDPIEILDTQIGGGYLDIYFALYTGPLSRHTLNLIVNKVDKPGEVPEGYIAVEFRQNAGEQMTEKIAEDYVSFRLGDLDPALSGNKGLYIRYKNTRGQILYHKVEIKTDVPDAK